MFSSCFSRLRHQYDRLASSQEMTDVEITEHYLCLISGSIMTTPVYDAHHTQYNFEYASILLWLSKKEENPYTRTALTETDLVVNDELKQEIAQFKALHGLKEQSMPPLMITTSTQPEPLRVDEGNQLGGSMRYGLWPTML